MGLFCKKKKEVEVEFNYEEMMKAAKLKYSKYPLDPEKPIHINKYENEEGYYTSLIKLLNPTKLSFVHKTQTSSSDITEKYEKTTDETNYIGVYDENNKLFLAFEIDLDKLYLYKYLANDTYLPRYVSNLYEKVDIQPIKNIELNKDLLSNYLIEDILYGIIYVSWKPFNDDITNDYIRITINMYIKSIDTFENTSSNLNNQ